MATILNMVDIIKNYPLADEEFKVLKSINLEVEDGEFLAVLGPSGSGKSTLMNIIGCLDTPTSGEYYLAGRRIDQQNEQSLAAIRNQEVGFIFQSFHLLPKQNALKNVELPLIYAGIKSKERRAKARLLLEQMGLPDKLQHLPNQLSGGQQQRVAIARALANDPSILLADEPTGALDQQTSRQVMDVFRELNAAGRTIIMITHDINVARNAKRVVHIVDGIMTEGEVESV
jgi:putative ABC transport system ATP-binding protein